MVSQPAVSASRWGDQSGSGGRRILPGFRNPVVVRLRTIRPTRKTTDHHHDRRGPDAGLSSNNLPMAVTVRTRDP
jgi:hypothetical protein